ncbi:MAG: protein kinase [Pyrinomonadaceae bacterium]|nr:protein kinase [Pyrinomonadaceae bacterium]
MPFCYECGAPSAPEDPFCGNCGIARRATPVSAPPPQIISSDLNATAIDPQPQTPPAPPPLIENVKPSLSETLEDAPAPMPEEPPRSVLAYESAELQNDKESASSGDIAPEMQETLMGSLDSLGISEPVEASDATASPAVETGEIDDAAASNAPALSNATEPDESLPAEPVSATSAIDESDKDAHEAEQAVSPLPEPSAPSAASEPASGTAAQMQPEIDTGQIDNEGEQPPDAAQPAASSEVVLQDTLAPDAIPDRTTGEVRADSSAPELEATVPPGSTSGRKQASKPLEGGTLLNTRYEIVRRIGGGGMGAVYLAKDRHLGDAPRAVKEMIETHLYESQHEKAIGDFKRESLLLTSLEHSSIPTIYDYFYDDVAGRFYLVMKYISGGDFSSRQRNAPGGRIDEKTVTIWGMETADVLDYLHNRRPPIIYRDLKPANLMIDGNSGRVMLIDFGIARWVNKLEEKGVTAVGTMGYAPPELFSGKVEPRSDIYSLGATMFHLLTGSDPQDNPLLIFDFTKNPRPRQINPAISVEMERILMRAVEYKPEGRFRSAGEFRETLAAHLEKLRVGDVSYGMVTAAQGAGETLQVEMVFCGFCGGRIAADDLFCAHCGAKQPLAGISPSAALQAARTTAKLIVAGTTELDASFHLQKDSSLIGRSDPHSNIFPEVDLSKFDPETKVSRRHARIWRKGETFLVEDLGSVNGTVVLGRDNDTVRLAPHQPRVLENGDKLRLGETMLHFLVG